MLKKTVAGLRIVNAITGRKVASAATAARASAVAATPKVYEGAELFAVARG